MGGGRDMLGDVWGVVCWSQWFGTVFQARFEDGCLEL